METLNMNRTNGMMKDDRKNWTKIDNDQRVMNHDG